MGALFFISFSCQIGLKDDGDCKRQTDDSRVPRIVYFVIFGDYTFKFWHYVSIMAAKRHVSPSALYVIGDAHPLGYWWKRVMRDCKGVRFLYRSLSSAFSLVAPPKKPQKKPITAKTATATTATAAAAATAAEAAAAATTKGKIPT